MGCDFMMISPEGYYEEFLKGKSAPQILTAIRGLKQEMGRLKNKMEHPDYLCLTEPSEDTRLWCTRLYLERAKEALLAAGGKYVPSQAELRAADFDANIPAIEQIIFSQGGFFNSTETRTVTFAGEQVHMQGQYPMVVRIEPEDPYTKADFLYELRKLHLGEWRKNYVPERFGYSVLDGTQWQLTINFSNGHKPLKVYGSNAYPYNYHELLELLDVDQLGDQGEDGDEDDD
jgi:hypothetical protein